MEDVNVQFAIVFTIQCLLMAMPIVFIAHISNKLVAYLRNRK